MSGAGRLKCNLDCANYEGAMDDCNSAVTVLIRRINGEADLASAAEWVRLNYPKRAAEIHDIGIPITEQSQSVTPPVEGELAELIWNGLMDNGREPTLDDAHETARRILSHLPVAAGGEEHELSMREIAALRADLDATRKEVERLREALRPFAEHAEELKRLEPNGRVATYDLEEDDGSVSAADLKAGDFFNARAALSNTGEEGQ